MAGLTRDRVYRWRYSDQRTTLKRTHRDGAGGGAGVRAGRDGTHTHTVLSVESDSRGLFERRARERRARGRAVYTARTAVRSTFRAEPSRAFYTAFSAQFGLCCAHNQPHIRIGAGAIACPLHIVHRSRIDYCRPACGLRHNDRCPPGGAGSNVGVGVDARWRWRETVRCGAGRPSSRWLMADDRALLTPAQRMAGPDCSC